MPTPVPEPTSPSGNPFRVGAEFPDPPFEFDADGVPTGFDIDLTRMIANALGRPWLLVRADYNGIFAGLDRRQYDCVASGTTITPQRQRMADFCHPYVASGQSLVVDVERHPAVRSTADLRGLVIGVQHGNTSEPVAERLVAGARSAACGAMPTPTSNRLWMISRPGHATRS